MHRSIIILLVLLSTHLYAQEEKNFSLYSAKEGLSENQVTAITQDSYGYIWVGTRKGLNRFDGNSFQHFYSDSSDNSLPIDYVRSFRWLSMEKLGVVTMAGFFIMNTRTLKGHSLIIPADTLLLSYQVNKLTDANVDEKGNLFLLSGTGFYHYNNKEELMFRYDAFSSKTTGSGPVQFGRSIFYARENIVLISTIRGLWLYNVPKRQIRAVNSSDDDFYKLIVKDDTRFHIMHDNPQSFTLNTDGEKELSYHDIANRTKSMIRAPQSTLELFRWRSKFTVFNDSLFALTAHETGFYLVKADKKTGNYSVLPGAYFGNYHCSSIFRDKDNIIWIGTNKGLFRQKRSSAAVERVTIPTAMNPTNKDLAIRNVALAGNKIFLATAKEGVIVLDSDNMSVLKKIDLTGYDPIANNVINIVALNDDTIIAGGTNFFIWISSQSYKHGLINLPGRDPLKQWTAALYKDSKGTIYTCTNYVKEFYFRRKGEKEFTRVVENENPFFNIHLPRRITEDPAGNIWFSGNGLSRFNHQTKKFDQMLNTFPNTRIEQKETSALVFDQNGKLYFGLLENGLLIYDTATKNFRRLTRSDGLPDNNISALYLQDNHLWMGTESGIASYDIVIGKIASFGIGDDMPAEPFTSMSFSYDSVRRRLYGAFNNTIVRFDPRLLHKNSIPPRFFIESIRTSKDHTIHHPGDTVHISYKENNLVIDLAAINFEDAYQQQFAYRFVGSGNEEWQETGFQRSMLFSNLAPGRHRLQVKVFIKNNNWPAQVKEILIIVKPPYWQTGWFRATAVLALLSIIFILYRWRIKSIRQKANIDKQLAELEMKGLHAQMNPHFIFNSLNSIKEMILVDEKQNASRYLSKFAALIRTNLDHSRQTFITIDQCVDHLKQYLEMEKIRFDSFYYNIVVDENIPEEVRIAPLLVQPLVENAIWHGLRNINGEKRLLIQFSLSGDELVCIIDDNGIGIDQSVKDKEDLKPTHRSLGITSIRERLKVLNEKYKMYSSLDIIDKSSLPRYQESGTVATLRFKL